MLEGGQGVGEGLAVGVVEMDADDVGKHALLAQQGEQFEHVSRCRDADGVAQAQLVAAHVHQRLADARDLVQRDRALPGVTEAHGDIAADMGALVLGVFDDGLEHGQRLVHRAVEVGLREGLGGAGEDGDPVRAEREGAVEAAPVGDEDGQVHALEIPHQREQLLGVGQLGHPLRVYEARRLDRRQPRVGQAADELRLHLGGHRRLLVLQAVTGADLVDPDPLGQIRSRDDHGETSDGHFSSWAGVMTAST